MPVDNSYNSKPQRKESQIADGINLTKLFIRMLSKWYFFIIAIILALAVAYLYLAHSIPKYLVSATLLIDQNKTEVALGSEKVFEGFGIGSDAKNLDNQIMILTSRTLIGKTLDELNLDLEVYQRDLFDKKSFYPNHPIKVTPEDSLPSEVEFSFNLINNDLFELQAEISDSFKLKSNFSFGEDIKLPGGTFHIESVNFDWDQLNGKQKIFFLRHDHKKLVDSYCSRIQVNQASRLGTILRIFLEGTNQSLNIDFINRLMEIFLNNSLDKKNLEAIRTIAFIDEQLIGISDSLVITENRLQEFRSRNKVMDLSIQGQVIINQAMNLENEKARIAIETNYYNYLSDYLSKEDLGEVPIAPATMGITDPGLAKLVADLADLHGQYYSKSMGIKNPLQSQLLLRINNTKEALQETLRGLRNANNLAREENLAQIRTVNAQATALPMTERQLLGIERKFKLNDALYTFLLEKRAVAQIQKASNLPDNQVIDPAEPEDLPVKPKKTFVYFTALLAGFFIPFISILSVDALNNKVKEEDDILRITDIPITGHIPHNSLKTNTVVFDEPNSHVSEAFRSLRSKMQFFVKETKSGVILITSSVPGEGKTFTAINLASVYSLLGKKTVIIGLDLRNPQIYIDFGLDNSQGVSTWLIGKDGLNDIIKNTEHENLWVIPAGPVPPNPSELLALEKTEELISLLKEKFEYIIIDSSPIGTISDTYHLSALADTSILVVRQNKTFKEHLEFTIEELKFCKIKSIGIVVNDLKLKQKRYGFSGKYGYPYS